MCTGYWRQAGWAEQREIRACACIFWTSLLQRATMTSGAGTKKRPRSRSAAGQGRGTSGKASGKRARANSPDVAEPDAAAAAAAAVFPDSPDTSTGADLDATPAAEPAAEASPTRPVPCEPATAAEDMPQPSPGSKRCKSWTGHETAAAAEPEAAEPEAAAPKAAELEALTEAELVDKVAAKAARKAARKAEKKAAKKAAKQSAKQSAGGGAAAGKPVRKGLKKAKGSAKGAEAVQPMQRVSTAPQRDTGFGAADSGIFFEEVPAMLHHVLNHSASHEGSAAKWIAQCHC